MSKNRKYNPELKAEAINMVRDQAMTQSEVSKKLGIPKVTIAT